MRPRDLAERDADRLGRYGRRDQAPLEPRLDEARARLGSDGRIRIVTGGAAPWWHVLVRQYADVLIAILGAAAAISFAIGETVDAAAILAILLLNGPLGFAQEWRAERAIAALARMLVQRATVVRDGREQEVDAEELVAGDVVVLAGAHALADLRALGREVAAIRESSTALRGAGMGPLA